MKNLIAIKELIQEIEELDNTRVKLCSMQEEYLSFKQGDELADDMTSIDIKIENARFNMTWSDNPGLFNILLNESILMIQEKKNELRDAILALMDDKLSK